MMQTAVFDTKPYDREPLQLASAGLDIEWRFLDCRLTVETAAAAHGAHAVCTFVNDRLDRPCLEALAKLDVRHIALRCAGFNSIDLAAAREIGFTVTRVGLRRYGYDRFAARLAVRLGRGETTFRILRRAGQILFPLREVTLLAQPGPVS